MIMGKKKKEVVVLNQTELMPTNIGTLNTKQGSPIVVLIIILIFVAGIFSLDYIVSWLNPESEVTPYVPNPTPTPTPDTPEDQTKENAEKHEITSDLAISLGTVTFTSFNVNTSTNTLDFVVKSTGTSNLLVNRNYFIELYSSADILLQRIKLDNIPIVENKSFSYDITSALSTGGINKISILEIKEEDYPSINLTTNAEKVPILTCSLNNTSLEYQFASTTNNTLEKIIEKRSITETEEDYDELLAKYENLKDELDSIEGVTVEIIPQRGGFKIEIEIDLATIPSDVYKKNFKEVHYYAKDSLAKKISFELSSSSYTCK